MSAPSCDQIEPKLLAYADGELVESESAAVAEHLAGCDACRQKLAALQRSLGLARVIWEDHAADLAQAGWPPISARRSSHPARWVRPRRVLIAAGILLLLAGWTWQMTRETDLSPTPPANEPSLAELQQQVRRAGVAAQLLAAADYLAEQPGGRDYACERYRYVRAEYAETDAARECEIRVRSLCETRSEP